MRYEVYTIIHARVVVDADSETEAFTQAEERAREWIGDKASGKLIVAAREAEEVSALLSLL